MKIEVDNGDIVLRAEPHEQDLLGVVYLWLADVPRNNVKLEGTLTCEPVHIFERGHLGLIREGKTTCCADAISISAPEPLPIAPPPTYGCYYCLDGCEPGPEPECDDYYYYGDEPPCD